MKTSCEIAKYFHDKICKIAKKYKIKLVDLERDWNKSGDESDYDSDEYEEIRCNKIEFRGKTYLLDICTNTVYNYEYPHDEV